MNFLELLRVALFVIEWIWTACATFLFPDKLVGKNAAVQPSGNVCYFDRQLDLSRCNFGFAWGLIAFLILSATLVWYSLGFCSSIQLPANVEVIIFSWLALWWVCIVLSHSLKHRNSLPASKAYDDVLHVNRLTNIVHAYFFLVFLVFDISSLALLSSLLSSLGRQKVKLQLLLFLHGCFLFSRPSLPSWQAGHLRDPLDFLLKQTTHKERLTMRETWCRIVSA